MAIKLNERTLALLVPRSGSNVLPYGLTLEPLVLIIPHGKTLNRRGQMLFLLISTSFGAIYKSLLIYYYMEYREY